MGECATGKHPKDRVSYANNREKARLERENIWRVNILKIGW